MQKRIAEMVSVIIPAYNYAKLLPRALDSVLTQTYDNLECIIVDDGSSDNTRDVVYNFISRDCRFKYIYQDNKGLSASRNAGYQHSKGEYIQFLDADDFIYETKLELQILYLRNSKSIDIHYTGYKIYDINLSKEYEKIMPCELGNNPIEDFLLRWERELSIPIHCALFRSSLFSGDPFFGKPFDEELKAKEDWMMWCKLAQFSSFQYLDMDLAFYTRHMDNMCRDKFQMGYSFFQAATKIINTIPDTLKSIFIAYTFEHLQKFYANPELLRYRFLNIVAENFRRWQHTVTSKISVIFFGTGGLAQWIMLMLDSQKIDIQGFFDNNNAVEDFKGFQVQKPIYIPGKRIIIASSYEKEIRSQLLQIGYADADVLCFCSEQIST